MKKRTDILIIGGGASGLACAAAVGESFDGKIILLEHKPKVGKKILVTGNGRCNLSNRNISEEFYHGSFNIAPLLEEYSDLRMFFEKTGLYTVSDSAGRIYPLSNTAASVADALRFAAEKNQNLQIITEAKCDRIAKNKEGFLVKAGEYEINAKTAVLACGGCAAPVHGSDGSGFALAKSLGISIAKPYPALCPLYVSESDIKNLDGLRSRCAASLFRNGQLEKTELGEVQFTKNGLSGICIFNLSAAFGDEEKNVRISFDLLPDCSTGEVYDMLTNALRCRKRDNAEDIFSGIFNRRLAQYLLKRADISSSVGSAKIDYADKDRLTEVIKGLDFGIRGRADFPSAQVTAGGVLGCEIDESLMSKRVVGLFFAGEIIDAWGDCGGYNLHFAFASGIKAGKAAAQLLREKGNNL